VASGVGPAFRAVTVPAAEVGFEDAVATYLFNSQLLPRPDGRWLLVAPADVRTRPRVAAYLERLVAGGGPIAEVLSFDLRESMANGGGPACLRLRVPLTAAERAAIGPRVWLDDALAADLDAWIGRNYRDRLVPGDLADPALLDESRRALDELTALLRLPPLYPFQRG
jgi:succinylarginine dihydrolase